MREKILGLYLVSASVIMTSGEFFGQKIYVPHFWRRYLDGEADQVEDGSPFFVVKPEERREFPELMHRTTLRLRVEGNQILEA